MMQNELDIKVTETLAQEFTKRCPDFNERRLPGNRIS